MRYTARLSLLFISALAAHQFSGGSLVDPRQLLVQGLAIGLILHRVRSIKLEGPGLALLILSIQSSSHFLLGGGSYTNGLRMTLAHGISGFLSYLAMRYFEIAWEFISSSFIALVLPRIFLTPTLPKLPPYFDPAGNFSFQIRQLIASLKFRGPPGVLEI